MGIWEEIGGGPLIPQRGLAADTLSHLIKSKETLVMGHIQSLFLSLMICFISLYFGANEAESGGRGVSLPPSSHWELEAAKRKAFEGS